MGSAWGRGTCSPGWGRRTSPSYPAGRGLPEPTKVGRVGGKALAYFQVLTTVALVLGLLVMNVTKPGVGVNADARGIKVSDTVSGFIKTGESSHWYDFIFHIFPSSVVGAFAEGDILQVLFFSVVFALALHGWASAAYRSCGASSGSARRSSG